MTTTNLYEFYQTPYGPDDGVDFRHSGVTRLVLFDCSEAFAATHKELQFRQVFMEEGKTINSPIIASFKTAVADSDKVQVHVVVRAPFQIHKACTLSIGVVAVQPSPPVGLKSIVQSCMNPIANIFSSKRKNSMFRFLEKEPHLTEQLSAGYKYLTYKYYIDSGRNVRDRVCFFGDGEGAFVANALAVMIRRVGVLKKIWRIEFDRYFWDAYSLSAYDHVNDDPALNMRITRCIFMRVELLGMWYDPYANIHQHKLCSMLHESEANASLSPIEGGDPFVGEVAVYKRLACDACTDDHFDALSCPLRHMIDKVQAICDNIPFNEEFLAGMGIEVQHVRSPELQE